MLIVKPYFGILILPNDIYMIVGWFDVDIGTDHNIIMTWIRASIIIFVCFINFVIFVFNYESHDPL